MFDAMREKALSLVGLGYIYGAQGQLCTLAFRKQQAEQYPEQYSNIMVMGAKWDGMRVWECAQLTQEVAAVAGIKLPSGATSQWTKYEWDERGEIDTLPTDELVFVYRRSKSNKNTMAHTGVYLGDGTVVDARGVEDGVMHEGLHDHGWTHWARPNWMNAKQPEENSRPTLRRGNEGAAVKEMQQLLVDAGYPLEKHGVDGDFGAETEKAVKDFQKDYGLEADGVVGKKTWPMLENPMTIPKLYTVIIKGLTQTDAEKIALQYGGKIQEA